MPTQDLFQLATALGRGEIDAAAGVVRGVAVITEGPARGHFDRKSGNQIMVDSATLESIAKCAAEYKDGLKVKMTHDGDAADIVGVLRNFHVDGKTLRADFHLLQSTPHRAYILEIAAEMPESFGLSVAFSGVREIVGKYAMARCSEIFSADLVSEPAANPNGLFQAGEPAAPATQPKPDNLMSDEVKEKDPVAELAALVASLTSRLQKLENPVAPKEDEEPAAMAAKLQDVADKAALSALKVYTDKFGAPPAKDGGSQEPKREDKAAAKFEDLVKAKSSELKSTTEAITFCVKNHAKEHGDYLTRVRAGEVITLG